MARIAFDSGDAGVTNGVNIGYTAATFAPDFEIANRDSGIIRFKTNDTERMRIKSSGNVGINQTDPSYPLHVFEASGDTAAIFIDGPTDGYSVLYLGDSDDIDRSMVSYNHTNDDSH